MSAESVASQDGAGDRVDHAGGAAHALDLNLLDMPFIPCRQAFQQLGADWDGTTVRLSRLQALDGPRRAAFRALLRAAGALGARRGQVLPYLHQLLRHGGDGTGAVVQLLRDGAPGCLEVAVQPEGDELERLLVKRGVSPEHLLGSAAFIRAAAGLRVRRATRPELSDQPTRTPEPPPATMPAGLAAQLPAVTLSVPEREALRARFEGFGLSGNESRVLLALLQLGSAGASQLVRLSQVPRTSIYQVLDALEARRLAEPLPGRVAIWASPGREQVLGRLYSDQEERLRGLAAGMEEARELLSRLGPETPSAAMPFVHLIRDASHTKRIYEDLLQRSQTEVLMFVKRPYSWSSGAANPVVLRTLERGVRIRVIYEAPEVADPDREAWRREVETYHQAGVRARMVISLPMKLAIGDRRIALLAMADPVMPEGGYPTNLFVDHPGFAQVQAEAFEQRWAAALPYARPSLRR